MTGAPLSGISVCIFDAYGTLFDLSQIVETCREGLGDRAGTLAELWRRKQLEYSWLRSLMGRHTDFWHVTGDALDFALEDLGISHPSLRSRLMEAYLKPRAYPEAMSALASLKEAGHRLGILSNGSPDMLTSGAMHSGLDTLLEDTLSVEQAGVFKPHPSVYRLATDRFACAPGDVAFISSNGWDAAGAAAFGFRVVWVNRAGQPRDKLPAIPDREITTLSELPDLLRR